MNDLAKFYEGSLYPLQNGVLSIVHRSNTPFFLTGGTALSRRFLHHRYSDDLDFFVSQDARYAEHVHTILENLFAAENEFGFTVERSSLQLSKEYAQMFVVGSNQPGVVLKIDLVNDISAYFGQIGSDPILGKIDNLRNILSNKLTALFRSEPKDVADIFAIARTHACNWKSIFAEAKEKEVGISPEIIYDLLMSFPLQYLDSIRWITPPKPQEFAAGITTIAEDILFGRDNSICPAGSLSL